MAHQYTTDQIEGMTAGTVTIQGHNGESIGAYVAKPDGDGPFPGVVLIHHIPGWDELYREFTRKFATTATLPYPPTCTTATATESPRTWQQRCEPKAARPTPRWSETWGARDWLKAQSYSNGKVGVIGSCSGGRHTVLVASRSTGWDAAVDLWGGRVVMPTEDLNERTPVAPIDYTVDLCCPLLGLFGEEDQSPTVAQVDQHEAALKANGKDYEFHMYPNAGHGFFYYDRAMYRQEAAVDGWQKTFAFFDKHLR